MKVLRNALFATGTLALLIAALVAALAAVPAPLGYPSRLFGDESRGRRFLQALLPDRHGPPRRLPFRGRLSML